MSHGCSGKTTAGSDRAPVRCLRRAHLAGHAWFTGERYGIADIALYGYTHTAGAIGFEIGPAVAGWLGRVRAQPRHIAIKAEPERS